MKKFRISLLKKLNLFFIVCLIAGLYTGLSASAGHVEKKVLILNSYNKGLTWTDTQTDSIVSKLKQEYQNINISIEYMDWKRYPTQELQQAFYNLIKVKYSTEKIDLIITTDDAALQFALNYRQQVLSNAPIVFSGVNRKSATEILHDFTNITGVIEEIDVEGTVKIALEINPNLRKIYLISDNTESGQSTGQLSLKAIRDINSDMIVETLNDLSQEEILKKLSKGEKDSMILVTTYFMDINNHIIDNEYFTRLLSERSRIPIYHIYGFSSDDGVVGGSMVCGEILGSHAADLAVKILRGEHSFNLPIIFPKDFQLIFDYKQLDRFNIPVRMLPTGSMLLNNPYAFYQEHKLQIISVVLLFIILLASVAILMFFLQKTKNMKNKLEFNNEELTQLYEELSATDDELKSQYEIIVNSQEDLLESENRYRLIVDATNDGIWDWDLLTGKVFFSDKWYDIFGFDKDSYKHTENDWTALIHPNDIDRIKKSRELYLGKKLDKYECEYRIRGRDGSYRWLLSKGQAVFDGTGAPIRMIGSHTDITEVKEYQQQLKYLAYHDQLTGLYNRTYFNENFSSEIQNISHEGNLQAMFFIDTDNFKLINDTLGHSYGDKVIIEVSKHLSAIADSHSYIFRLGGDEFIFYLTKAETRDEIEDYAKKIINSFKTPISIGDTTVNITVSIGIAIAPTDAASLDNLMKCADMAMYKSKEKGKNRYEFFNSTINDQIISRVNIEKQFKAALRNGEFLLHYQPLIDIKNSTIIGFEALVRWYNKELGLVPPLKFISIAEETGFIVPLGEWIIQSACSFISALNTSMRTNFKISVNISMPQILQENFCQMVKQVIKNSNLPPSLLQLEITESVIMESPDLITEKLQCLRAEGISIALDDFGTGYSSLGYLRNLPIDTLKIDKLFIDDIDKNDSKSVITDSIISLGHKIGLSVISEGVETENQIQYLKNYHCDIIQGYYYSKPLPADEIESFIEKHNSL